MRVITLLLFVFCSATIDIGCGTSQNPSPVVAQPTTTTNGAPGTMPSAAPGTSAHVTVIIPSGAAALTSSAFGANPLVISPGTMVVWMNHDTMAHTTTSQSGIWDSNNIPPGGTFSFQFNNVGVFPYSCKIHPNMVGTVEVNGSAGGIPGPAPSATPNPNPAPSVSASPILPLFPGLPSPIP